MRSTSGLRATAQFLYGAIRRMARPNAKPARSESGQAIVEYIVSLFLAVLPLIVFGFAMHAAFGRYLSPIYFMVGLPIP